MAVEVMWECHRCARVVDLTADDYCPVCGEELPAFDLSDADIAELERLNDAATQRRVVMGPWPELTGDGE